MAIGKHWTGLDQVGVGPHSDFKLRQKIISHVYFFNKVCHHLHLSLFPSKCSTGGDCCDQPGSKYGPVLPSLLPESKELAAVVCTIGVKLEKQVTNYFNRDEPLRERCFWIASGAQQ